MLRTFSQPQQQQAGVEGLQTHPGAGGAGSEAALQPPRDAAPWISQPGGCLTSLNPINATIPSAAGVFFHRAPAPAGPGAGGTPNTPQDWDFW